MENGGVMVVCLQPYTVEDHSGQELRHELSQTLKIPRSTMFIRHFFSNRVVKEFAAVSLERLLTKFNPEISWKQEKDKSLFYYYYYFMALILINKEDIRNSE